MTEQKPTYPKPKITDRLVRNVTTASRYMPRGKVARMLKLKRKWVTLITRGLL